MEKTNTMGISSPKKWRKKTRFFCRTLAIAWIAVIFTPLTLAAQEQKVSINVEQADISLVFQQIKEQTGLNFMYNTEQLKGLSPVTLHVANGTVEEALKKLFAGQPFEWQYDDNYIIIKKKEAKGETLQAFTVKGFVYDENKLPLPGATVQVVGTSVGTATSEQGWFSIELPVSAKKLKFSFVGFKEQEIAFTEKTLNDTLHIYMQEDMAQIEEVVVTGMFRKSTKTYTGSAVTITADELKQFGNRNVLQTLRNIDPSFNIIENNEWGSDPNKLPEVQIRGGSSIPNVDQLQDEVRAELNTPLVLVDGFESSLQTLLDMNERDIESITILKDASAAAIYGSRAANGVIVVETRKPQPG